MSADQNQTRSYQTHQAGKQSSANSTREVDSRCLADSVENKPVTQPTDDDFSQLLHALPVGVIFGSGPDTVTYVNEGWCQLSRRPASDALGENWKNLVHPEDLPAMIEGAKLFWADDSQDHSVPFAFRQLMPEAPPCWFQLQASKQRRKNGSLARAVYTLTDISKLKATESALRASERKFASLATSAPVAIFRHAPDIKTCVYVNEQWTQMTGHPREAAYGEGWMRFVHPEDLERIHRLAADFTADPKMTKTSPLELRQVLPDGSIRWVQAVVAKEIDETGKATGYIGTLHDVDRLKRAEKNIQALHSRLQAVLETNTIGIWELSLETGQLSWDDQMFQIYGVNPVDFQGTYDDWVARVHPDDPLDFPSFDPEVDEPIRTASAEFRIIRPDGETRHIYSTVYLEYNDSGARVRAIGVNIDITEQRITERALRESESKFNRIAKHLPGMIFRYVLHPDGTDEIAYVSRGISDLFELTADTLQGSAEKLWSRIHTDDRAQLRDEIARSARELKPFIAEYRLDLPSKGVRWAQSYAQPISADNGDVMWDGIMLDHTEHKLAQSELADTRYALEQITENVPCMIYRTLLMPDGNRKTIYVSSHVRQLYELEPDEVLQEQNVLLNHVHAEDVPRLVREIEHSAESLLPFRVDFRLLLPKQGLCWRRAVGQPNKTAEGETVWDGVVFDITQTKESEHRLQVANEQLARATSLKDEFLATMSHELRTPLNAILGMTEVLQEGIVGPVTEQQRESYSIIKRSSDHLLQLIDEVLDVAKIEAGSMNLELSSVSVRDLCDSSIQLVAQQAKKKSIELSSQVPGELSRFQGDEKRLRQVLVNLLGNAVKFTHPGGRVSLDVCLEHQSQLEHPMLCLSVVDDGIGIEPDEIESLFDPFVQADRSLGRQYEGTGLGLSLVRRFVELHGGVVYASSSPGRGSCFTVRLPYRRNSDNALMFNSETLEIPDSVTAEQTRQLSEVTTEDESFSTVLLAEDNPTIASVTQLYLESARMRVVLARNGEQAISLATDASPDIILMDIQMPGVDGLSAIQRLRSNPKTRHTPIIATTGLATPSDKERCIEAGASCFMSKPYSMAVLVDTIRAELAERRIPA